MKKLALLLITLSLIAMVLAGCADTTDKPTTEPLDITGVTFSDKTVTYDGNEHSVTVEGTVPEGVTLTYTGNTATNAGTYKAKATLKGDGYNPLVLNATLTVNKAEISGVTFTGKTVPYDGNEYSLTVEGSVPEGVSVTYTNNTATNAGTYNAKATLSGANYVTKVLPAVLIIEKATFTGISFSNETFGYDGTPHRIEIVGQLPEGSAVKYSCVENSSVENIATETGTYTVKATVTNPNYETAVYTAMLKITATDKNRYITYANGKLYFGNALDNDKLYSYTPVGGVVKVSYDVPYSFTAMGGTLYFRSYSVASSIKAVDATGTTSVAHEKGEYLCSDNTYLYYAVNGLTASSSGIYKLNPSQSEPTPVKLSEGKAKYLQCYGGYLYFADGSNGWKLSRISTNGGARTLVVDEKITCLTADNGYLYFTVDNLMGNYIANYRISNGETTKLTVDAGSNLTVAGDYLYYLNVDLLTSNVFGKGIYRVNAKPAINMNLPGMKVIGDDGENYSSLALAGNGTLAYYKVSTQMLCLYEISSGATEEILDGFTAPETVPLTMGSKTLAYGNYIYYLDLYNDKALYSYDTVSGNFSRITSCKVADFAIIGDTLYYNGVSYGVNNDLFRIDLKNGGVPQLVSKNDCNDIVTDGTNLYYVKCNGAGARTSVNMIAPDGTDTVLYSKGATYLTYYEGYIYFVDNKDLLKMPTEEYVYNQTVTVKKGNVDAFVIDDGVVYFREMYGVGWTYKRLSRINIDGTGYTKMMSEHTDPLAIRVVEDKIYYYTDTVLGTSGLYSIDKDAQEDKTPTLILERGTRYYAEDFTVLNGYIYFVNYYNNLGDSHFYRVNLANGKVEKLA